MPAPNPPEAAARYNALGAGITRFVKASNNGKVKATSPNEGLYNMPFFDQGIPPGA